MAKTATTKKKDEEPSILDGLDSARKAVGLPTGKTLLRRLLGGSTTRRRRSTTSGSSRGGRPRCNINIGCCVPFVVLIAGATMGLFWLMH